MTFEESLQDVSIRERQLEAHLLRSTEYLRQADRELKRQVSMLYLAIALLLIFQGFFTLHTVEILPASCSILIAITSILAIANCLLLIKTKTWLNRLNESWLRPEEKSALESLKQEKQRILTRFPGMDKSGSPHADLN